MKPRKYWRKGAILLQTLIMSVLLSMIAVMLLKWVFARYIIVSRVQRSAMANAKAVGYADRFVAWGFGSVPSNRSDTLLPLDSSPRNSISFQIKDSVAPYPPAGTHRVVVTYDED